jgi:CheY-specific phosphatase CheX
MKKQIFTIILFTIVSMSVFGQSFKLDATGANDMRLRTSGADRLTILPTTGNVGIGTITPNAKFDVNGDMSLSKKRSLNTIGIQNALDRQGASRIFIDVNGTVTLNGIAGGVDGLVIFLYTGSLTTLVINNLDVAALSADRIATHTGTSVTITARGGTSLIYDGATGNWRIYGFADENASWNSRGNAGTTPVNNFIGTTDNQSLATRTNNVERMRILNTGNVGIGTNNPDSKLHLANTSIVTTPIASTLLTLENNGDLFLSMMSGSLASHNNGIIFGSSLGNERGKLLYTPFTNQMDFATNNITRMSITGAGNVGIGTAAPTAKLDIEGDIVIKKTTITASGIQNALNRGGGSSIYFNVSGTVTLNGIAGGQDGMILYLFTSSAATLIINNENAGAIAANRIATNTSATVTISGRGGATLIYDSNTSLWRVIGIAN